MFEKYMVSFMILYEIFWSIVDHKREAAEGRARDKKKSKALYDELAIFYNSENTEV